MPTMKQKVDRIEVARQNIITSINNKGVVVASDAGIETLAGKVDDIQQGGGQENEFMTSTDLSYMFYGKNSTDSKVVAGLQRFSQNQITNLDHTFYSFSDYSTGAAFQYIKSIIENCLSANKDYCLGRFAFKSNSIIDLTNKILSGSCNGMFYQAGARNPSATDDLIIILDKNSLKNAVPIYMFNNAYGNITIKLLDNELIVSDSMYGFLSNAAVHIIDANNNELKEITINCDSTVSSNTVNMKNCFSNYNKFDRIHIKNGNKIHDYSYLASGCFGLKSIDGVDFSNVSSSFYMDLFTTSGSSYYTELGKLGIVNGTSFPNVFGASLDLSRIWNATADTVRDGQTIGYWYEDFANSLGNSLIQAQTITINTTLYNSLTQAQKELITDKGYLLASAS